MYRLYSVQHTYNIEYLLVILIVHSYELYPTVHLSYTSTVHTKTSTYTYNIRVYVISVIH